MKARLRVLALGLLVGVGAFLTTRSLKPQNSGSWSNGTRASFTVRSTMTIAAPPLILHRDQHVFATRGDGSFVKTNIVSDQTDHETPAPEPAVTSLVVLPSLRIQSRVYHSVQMKSTERLSEEEVTRMAYFSVDRSCANIASPKTFLGASQVLGVGVLIYRSDDPSTRW